MKLDRAEESRRSPDPLAKGSVQLADAPPPDQACPRCGGKGTVEWIGGEWEYDSHYPCPTCTTDRTAAKGTGRVPAFWCSKHGSYGPARFCCTCTREEVEAEVERLREALTAIRDEHEDIPPLVTFIDQTLAGP